MHKKIFEYLCILHIAICEGFDIMVLETRKTQVATQNSEEREVVKWKYYSRQDSMRWM